MCVHSIIHAASLGMAQLNSSFIISILESVKILHELLKRAGKEIIVSFSKRIYNLINLKNLDAHAK